MGAYLTGKGLEDMLCSSEKDTRIPKIPKDAM